MQFIDMRRLKVILVLTAIFLAVGSLYFSNRLANDLSKEEKLRMELWADAIRAFSTADESTGLSLVLQVLNANNAIPVIVTSPSGEIQTYRNVVIAGSDSIAYLQHQAKQFAVAGRVIRIDIDPDSSQYLEVNFDESLILTRLSIFPYVQLGVVMVFVLIAIFALLSFKKSEQNRVWVGLSKETAHQLGTPISSLYAWRELLKDKYPADELLEAMSQDIDRLQMVANRFSKIGSAPELSRVDLNILLTDVIRYMRARVSSKVVIQLDIPSTPALADINVDLFGWVIENLCKNAIDAMAGVGRIDIKLHSTSTKWIIDVADPGKGIIKSKQKAVFNPGYTTKKRGWGLGLSLARRIVEEYHKGYIFVKSSEVNKGTVFRIELKK